MAKDDIVIGLGRPMYGSSVHANRKKAYPSVITTLGQMEPEARRWIAVHNFLCRSYLDSDYMKKTYLTAKGTVISNVHRMVQEAIYYVDGEKDSFLCNYIGCHLKFSFITDEHGTTSVRFNVYSDIINLSGLQAVDVDMIENHPNFEQVEDDLYYHSYPERRGLQDDLYAPENLESHGLDSHSEVEHDLHDPDDLESRGRDSEDLNHPQVPHHLESSGHADMRCMYCGLRIMPAQTW